MSVDCLFSETVISDLPEFSLLRMESYCLEEDKDSDDDMGFDLFDDGLTWPTACGRSSLKVSQSLLHTYPTSSYNRTAFKLFTTVS